MGWFGGGDKVEESHSSSSFGGLEGDFDSSGFDVGSIGGGANMSDFQQFSLALQQSVLVQQVITELSHRAFEKCCTSSTRENHLTGKEVACISSATNKWLDANEFLAGRLQLKQQKAAGQQF